ncbi:MAG TPA: hypothetical protein VL125_17630 [Pelobium sp.]|nr:hypothetical protein [Pelobium sp.]
MKKYIVFLFGFFTISATAQTPVDVSKYKSSDNSKVSLKKNILTVSWPVGNQTKGQFIIDLTPGNPLLKSVSLESKGKSNKIATNLDPAFILNVGKRTLDPKSGGWDVFFDKVPEKPFNSYQVVLTKNKASVSSEGAQTIIKIGDTHAGSFKGELEITLYNGSPLFNIAAVMATDIDSTAILYDAGLVSEKQVWDDIAWSDTQKQLQTTKVNFNDTAKNLEVKYRTVIGVNKNGSLAVFPAPHQYFYPLDEAFNLKFTWYGNGYQNQLKGFGLGIRQDVYGDKRFVPWFNARPKTKQRLNFFCLLSAGSAGNLLDEVKKFTHNDVYPALPGFKTMQSHFHNEFIMNVVLAGKEIPENPEFVKVFKADGVDIVHLGEFHYTAHPKGPENKRLTELKALFEQCERLSDKNFLLLPGEEPNEFFGGHWMQLFPKPVYWIMSRKPDQPFVTDSVGFGKIYRIADKYDMLKLLESENGLAWTAHARTKGSTFYPDKYKEEAFFKSDRFLGAAWKNIPADLSLPTLSRRILDLMDDTNNWGLKKHYIGESDLFTITKENEMYAHSNVNYLQLNELPDFKNGWQEISNAMQKGKFFTTTGEILLPFFAVNGKGAGETVQLGDDGEVKITVNAEWTFPLNFIEIISGDGNKVYKDRIDLRDSHAFGKKNFTFPVNLKNRTWVRLEAWDVAVNGAFTQTVWLNK